MLVVYVVLLVVWGLLLLLKRNYKKEKVCELKSKEHPLRRLYGPAMWISDHLPGRLVFENTRINHSIRKICVKENVKEQVYLYVVRKVALVLVIMIAGTILGFLSMMSGEKDEIVKTLKRGSGEKTYSFVANKNGKKENVDIRVAAKKLTQKEIQNILEKSEKELIKKMLSKNKSVNHIDQKVNLVNDIGEYGIGVTWNIDKTDVLGYDGEIGAKVSKDGEVVRVKATLELEDVREDYVIALKVFPRKSVGTIASEVQQYVDEQPENKKTIKLPARINNKKYSFYREVSKWSVYVLPLCLIVAIIIFVLKDKDLDKEVAERNKEMIVDYPEIISKFLIYFGAGLSFKSSLDRIVNSYQKDKMKSGELRYAYEELDYMNGRIKNGVSDARAVAEFGERCKVHCYMKFANIVAQNLRRGTSEMLDALKTEVDSAMTERKNNALKAGAEISTKLLGPMVLMLMIAVAIIMMPALLSINI